MSEQLEAAERETWHRRDRALLQLSQRDPRGSIAEGQRWLAEVAPGSEAEAWAWRAYSHPLRAVGNYHEALARVEDAERRFGDLDLPVEVARSAAGHVWTLRYLGRYDEAVRLARRVRRFFRSRGELLDAARLTNNLGTLYRPMGRLRAARRCYVDAARDFRRCGDLGEEASATSNLGNVLAELGRYDEAEWAQRRAIHLWQRLDRPAQLARGWLNLGTLLKRRGDYGRALVVLRQSRDLASQVGATNGVPFADLELAQTYLSLNLQPEADEAVRAARTGFEQLAMPQELGEALLWSAALAQRRGEWDEAAAWFAEAMTLFRRHGNQLWEAVTTILVADLDGANDAALAEVTEAERRLRRLRARDRALTARLVRADLLRRHGRAPEALALCRAAARGIARLGNPELAYRVNVGLGQLLERAAPRRALSHYRTAIEHLETLRRRARADDLKLALMADKLDIYQQATGLLLAGPANRRRLAEALAMAERAKSTGLLEEMLTRAERGGQATAAVARRLRDLRARLGDAYERREVGGRASREGASDLGELEQAVASATRELQLALRDEPVVAPFDLARLQAALPAEAVLLAYYSHGAEVVCFVVDSAARGGGLRLHRGLGTVEDARQLAERLSFQVRKGIFGASYLENNLAQLRPAFDRVLAELWRQLLAPMTADLERAGHVVIVAHGPLHGLPLHAALDDRGTYLAERLGVTYAPSARVFTACAERERGPAVRPLFVGPDDEQLPWVPREVTALAHLYPGSDALIGRHATRTNLRRRAGRFDLLHLATHGQFRADNPGFSALKLADGWLNVGDLAELSRDATLVTLSACETGRNRLEAGEELVGLTRAVLGGGASSLLASLWSVHDRATCRFMAEFYGGLAHGLGKASSLQRAMGAVRRELDHPFFWAPFALSGSA